MIPLASIEGKVVFMVVAAVVGVINWWLEKKKKDAGTESPDRPPAPRTSAPGTVESESEQERLRRFLEALGVPQPPQSSPPQRQAPPIAKPQPPPQATVRQRDRRLQVPRAVAKPAQKIARRPARTVFNEPEEMQRAGRIEEAASSIERISGEFTGMNVRVPMPPVQTPETAPHLAIGNAGTTTVLERVGNPLVASLQRTLRNPIDIRAAFLAAELLGPPRGLQK